MTTIKTAISLQTSLFDQAEELARELNVSRSRLFVLALEEFIRQYQDRKLFEQINRASDESALDEGEPQRLHQSTQQHRRLVEGEW